MRAEAALGPLGRSIHDAVLAVWPDHQPFLQRRFAGEGAAHLAFCERIAGWLLRLTHGQVRPAAEDYRWMCERLLEEEYHFRRAGTYRSDRFEQVQEAVYANPGYMPRYVRGLLLSQLLWANHAHALERFATGFLGRLAAGCALLEVGPGHGLLLALAAERTTRRLRAWDVSPSSVAATRRALETLGVPPATVVCRDLLAGPAEARERFDAVVASELIEHLEAPELALRRLAGLLRPGGWLYVNAPVNSPAPDHLALWRSPEELFERIASVPGLELVATHRFPATGHSEESARRHRLTISCVAICRRGDAAPCC